MSCSSSSSSTSTRRGVNSRPRGRPRMPGWRSVLESRATASGLGRPSTRVGSSSSRSEPLSPSRYRSCSATGRRSSMTAVGLAPDGADPVGQLLGVGHRRRQAHQVHPVRGVDDDLLPHRAPVGVLQVVDLVEDHVAQPVEGRRGGVDHVAQHLGGHHHHRRVAVDGVVPGQQADRLGAVAADQLPVLLVGQGLQRGGVEGLGARRRGPGPRRTGPPRSCPIRSARPPPRSPRHRGRRGPGAGTRRARSPARRRSGPGSAPARPTCASARPMMIDPS